jgi:hypothetical protein
VGQRKYLPLFLRTRDPHIDIAKMNAAAAIIVLASTKSIIIDIDT